MSDSIPPNAPPPAPMWPALLGAALMAAWGAAQAAWMPSDGDPTQIATAAARLGTAPRAFGTWTAVDAPFDAEQSAAAGADGILSRTYQNTTTGQAVTVLLVCGPPSKIAVHPPTACYRGLGYEPESPPRVMTVDAKERPSEFATAIFRRTGSERSDAPLEVLWAWSTDGDWKVPGTPRIAFAGEPVLYKLYLVRERSSQNSRRSDDQMSSFAAQLVESLRPAIVPPSEEPPRG